MRAVIYARISRDIEGTGLGVQRQLADCREAASARGWNVVGEFVDNDVSATRSKVRPEYQKMMAELTAGRAGALIVWDVDRLTRTPRELEDVIDLADSRSLALVSIGGDIDLGTAQGRLTARIKGSLARHETEQMGRRLRRKFQERAENGLPHAQVPFGWRRVQRVAENGRSSPVDVLREDEAGPVREAARRVLSGESLRSVTLWMNESGVPTPRESGRWSSTQVRQVLLRPTMAGLRQHRGEIMPGTSEPIISEDEFYRLRSLLTDPARRHQFGTTPAYLLTGIALCGLCGGAMRYLKGHVKKDGKAQPPAYGCRECFKTRRAMALADAVVEGAVLARLQLPDALEALTPPNHEGEAERLRERVGGLQGQLDEAADMFAGNLIDGAQLRRISARLRPELEDLRERLAALTPASAVGAVAGPDAVERWEASTIFVKRDIVQALMTVTILPVGPGRGRDPESIRIEWKV